VYEEVDKFKGTPRITKTLCCGRGVFISWCEMFNIKPLHETKPKDDWGLEIMSTDKKPRCVLQEELVDKALDLFSDNRLNEALDVLRDISNPLTAGWVVHAVLEGLDRPGTSQQRNWLINALYNGK
jgi:hypothetical protein